LVCLDSPFTFDLYYFFSCDQICCSRPRQTLIGAVVFAGFKMPAGVPNPPPVAADSSGAGAEEDGMPKEDPSKLERAPGEEDEEVRSCLVAQPSASLSCLGDGRKCMHTQIFLSRSVSGTTLTFGGNPAQMLKRLTGFMCWDMWNENTTREYASLSVLKSHVL